MYEVNVGLLTLTFAVSDPVNTKIQVRSMNQLVTSPHTCRRVIRH